MPIGDILIRDRGYNENTIPHTMNYINYEKAIVVQYRVELVGSTHNVMENPGNIKTGAALNALLSALTQGVCYWKTLTAAEWAARKLAHELLEKAGVVVKRKQRSDAGKSKNPHRTATGKVIQEAGKARPHKRRKAVKSVRTVQEDHEEEGEAVGKDRGDEDEAEDSDEEEEGSGGDEGEGDDDDEVEEDGDEESDEE